MKSIDTTLDLLTAGPIRIAQAILTRLGRIALERP